MWGTGRLRDGGPDPAAAALDADILLRHAAGLSREEVLARPGSRVPGAVWSAYGALIAGRLAGTPIAYLVGRREFFGIDLAVDRRVLIPRPETERLVEVLLDGIRDRSAPLIVDVGTGSGAIAIAAACARPDASVLATDVSSGALDLARANAQRAGVAERITWLYGPGLAPLAGRSGGGAPHAIVSNPPYIPSAEVARLPLDVREHEPTIAVDGGPDGLDVHRCIVREAARYLAPGGLLALEVAALWDQAVAVAGLITEAGGFGAPRIVRDYAGTDRVVAAYRGNDGHPRD